MAKIAIYKGGVQARKANKTLFFITRPGFLRRLRRGKLDGSGATTSLGRDPTPKSGKYRHCRDFIVEMGTI